jgi:hypothetical protein
MMIMKEAVDACFNVILQNLPGATEENHENSESEYSVTRLVFEPGTSQIQV